MQMTKQSALLLSWAMGSAPRDVERQTLIRWVGVFQAPMNAVPQYLGCVWTGHSETRSDLSQGTLSHRCFSLRVGFSLRPSSVEGWQPHCSCIWLHVQMKYVTRTRRLTDPLVFSLWPLSSSSLTKTWNILIPHNPHDLCQIKGAGQKIQTAN